jgi:hypothetical protein
MLQRHDDAPRSNAEAESGWSDIYEPANVTRVMHGEVTDRCVDAIALGTIRTIEVLPRAPRPENFTTHERNFA